MDADTFAALATEPGRGAIAHAMAGLDAGLGDLAVGEDVRRHFPTLPLNVASAAVEQATLRRRGRAKFGDTADGMWFTADGLEQATSAIAAKHRAQRFGALSSALRRPAKVADLCCGIGSDLRAIAAAGCAVSGFDSDPVTVLAAKLNGDSPVECIDVESVDLRDYDAAFIDPARRGGGRRTFDVNAYSPPWSFVVDLLAAMPAAAAKVAPGIPHELVPAGLEVEWVSVGGALKEAVLWAGRFTDGATRRRATLLPSGATMQAMADADEQAPTDEMRRYLYEPDDAVVRAHLIGDLARSIDGVLLDATTAYLTSDRLVETPFARALEVHDVMAFSLKRLRTALRERDIGGVTIMKRGSAVDVERLRRDLRLEGTKQAVVVLALIGGKHHAVIADDVVSRVRPA
jgi:SAM-dependent methyltransferase